MKLLLYLKPWLLFIILCVIVFCPDIPFLLESIAVLAFWLIYTSWIYQIGITMNSYIPLEIRPSLKYFRILCLFPPIIYLISSFYNYFIQYQLSETIQMVIMISIAFFIIGALIYICMYAARMLESVIEGELANKSDSLKGFFCLLIFPIGVWYIQPAVQRVLIKYKDPHYLVEK